MTWTILILAVAIAAFLFADKLAAKLPKKATPATGLIKGAFSVIVIGLLVIGINRLGVGTHHYLVNSNPAILKDMAQNMQEQERRGTSREIRRHIRANADDMARHAPVLGNPNASQTIWVWSDAFCSFCRRLHHELERVIEARDDVRVVIKTFPVRGEIADISGRWTVAATLQGQEKAAALYKKVMENDYWGKDPQAANLSSIIIANLRNYARTIGLDVEQLERDANGPVVMAELAQTRELAQRFQIQGTPFLIIGDQTFPGAIPFHQIMGALR